MQDLLRREWVGKKSKIKKQKAEPELCSHLFKYCFSPSSKTKSALYISGFFFLCLCQRLLAKITAFANELGHPLIFDHFFSSLFFLHIHSGQGLGGYTRRTESNSLFRYGGAKTRQKKTKQNKLCCKYLKAILKFVALEDWGIWGRMRQDLKMKWQLQSTISALNPNVTLWSEFYSWSLSLLPSTLPFWMGRRCGQMMRHWGIPASTRVK